MEIDINTLRGLATIFCMVAFLAVVIWAYSDRKRLDFEEAANLPFQDDSVGTTSLTKEADRSSHKRVLNNKKESPHV